MTTKALVFSVCLALLVGLTAGTLSAGQGSGDDTENTLLSTYYPLDEPRGYCIDISGTGRSANLDNRLQVHSEPPSVVVLFDQPPALHVNNIHSSAERSRLRALRQS